MDAREKTASEFYIDDHAVLYGLSVKYARELCGAAGDDAAVRATVVYARERGLRMAMRCKADGKALTPNNYLDYGEWVDDRKWSDFRPKSLSDNFTLEAFVCGWNESWKRHGLQEYGAVYCTWIDKELVRGFNPDNSLELDGALSHGADTCTLRFMGACYPDEQALAASVQARGAMRQKNVKDFLYHTAHLLSAFRRTYLLELGLEKATAVLDKALVGYAEKFGPAKTTALQQEARLDFLTV